MNRLNPLTWLGATRAQRRTRRLWIIAAFVVGMLVGMRFMLWYIPPFKIVQEASWDAFRDFGLHGFDLGADSVRRHCELKERRKWKQRLAGCGIE